MAKNSNHTRGSLDGGLLGILVTWGTPDAAFNGQAPDGTFANARLDGGSDETPQNFAVAGFGFTGNNQQNSVAVLNVKVEIFSKAVYGYQADRCVTHVLRLAKDASDPASFGTSRGDTNGTYPWGDSVGCWYPPSGSATTPTYWGYADLNVGHVISTKFGVNFACENFEGQGTQNKRIDASVDAVRITVTYASGGSESGWASTNYGNI